MTIQHMFTPDSAERFRSLLESDIAECDAKISELQQKRFNRLEELAQLQNAMISAGHTPINLTQAALPSPTQTNNEPGLLGEPTSDIPKLGRYTKGDDWSLRDKAIYMLLKESIARKENAALLSTDIIDRIIEIEPEYSKGKNISTILGQNTPKIFTRLESNGKRLLVKLTNPKEAYELIFGE